MSDVAAALAFVDDFEANGGLYVSWKLDRQITLNRIRAMIQDPDIIYNAGLNACGPTVFFRIWFGRDPLAAAIFACNMLRDGYASIGYLLITPKSSPLEEDYNVIKARCKNPIDMPEQADWMLLCSLFSSENVFGYSGDPTSAVEALQGVTLPSTLCSWLSATGLYSTPLADDTSLVLPADSAQLFAMEPDPNKDIVLLVSSKFMVNFHPYPNYPSTNPEEEDLFYPANHYVLVKDYFNQNVGSPWLSITIWSWGKVYKGWVNAEAFYRKYYGNIIASAL